MLLARSLAISLVEQKKNRGHIHVWRTKSSFPATSDGYTCAPKSYACDQKQKSASGGVDPECPLLAAQSTPSAKDRFIALPARS
jgi:hypothetical protein